MAKVKKPTKAQQWAEACSQAISALETLISMQEEYQEKLDNLPENLHNSPYGEKLQAVCDLDLQSALDTTQEADGADLPLGYGRD